MITYYRLNQDNTILDFISNPSIRHPYLNLENVLQTDKEIMRGNDGKLYFAGEEPITPPPTPEQIQKTLTDAVQAHLDTKVKERGYDSILSACSYVNSSDPTFQAEALACVAWRDAVWRTCYNILDEVMAGEREIPTAEELIAELPELVWPDEIIPE